MKKEKQQKQKQAVKKIHGEKLAPSKVLIKIAVIVLGALLYTMGVKAFVSPNGFVTGGVWGIALMIEHLTTFPSGIMVFILNVPLLVISVIFLGWRFTIYTLLFVGVQSGISTLMSYIDILPTFTEDAFLAAIAGGVIMGAGLAFCLKVGGSTGGTDIISVIIQRRNTSINIPWIIFIVNVVIIAVSFFVYGGLKPVILSIILEFVISKISDLILNGFSSAIRFEIVTSYGKEMQDAIVNKLGRGATVIEARGAYTNDPKTVLVCLIHKRQISAFNKMLLSVDPHAFAYISAVSSVRGKGFSNEIDETGETGETGETDQA